MVRFVFLGSDILLFLSFGLLSLFVIKGMRKPINRQAMKRLVSYQIVMVTLSVLAFYLTIALLDSIHFQRQLSAKNASSAPHYSAKTQSVLDLMFGKRSLAQEKTYSAPLALRSFSKEVRASGGQYYPRLIGINSNVKTLHQRNVVMTKQILFSLIYALCISIFLFSAFKMFRKKVRDERLALFPFVFKGIIMFVAISCIFLEVQFHLFGTDKVGQDVFYQTIKSIRTGLVIGLITTLVTLPFALILGLSAGYFGGKVDDLIQYLYITISSIPGVLLIAASILSMQVFISNHADMFSSLMARADARLVALCLILGLTGWTGLCRVLRAETLKLREMDYIQAAKALGSSTRVILQRHVLPNVMHLIIIAVVLDFSSLVLAEAVLSYIGVGVSPLTISWGNMINGARLELAREPVVWWPMLAAFMFMFLFVISINLLADKVRDVFDPRS